MASKLTHDDVRRLAELARLELSEKDVDLLAAQLSDILGYAAQVQQIDTTGVTPTSHARVVETVLREDLTSPSLDRDTILRTAPKAAPDAGLFRVPKVL